MLGIKWHSILVLVLLSLAMPNYALAQTKKSKKSNSSKSSTPVRKIPSKKAMPTGLTDAQEKAFQLKQTADSLAAERWRILDSTNASRKAIRDSIAEARLNRTDSLAKIAKYKASKKYADSVDRVRTKRADSIKYERMAKLDKLKNERKDRLDSLVAARKANLEKLNDARTKTKDSLSKYRKEFNEKLQASRKKTTDSLAKIKKIKTAQLEKKKSLALEKLKKGFKTEDEKQMAKAMELHKKKNAAFTNQNFLKKPFTLNKRIYQNTVTRYNYFYNAKNKYNLSIESQEKSRVVNYNKLLKLNTYDPEESGAAVASEMDSVIKKCATGIQIHDPRSKWFDNLYFLTGKAYLAKNDLENAIATFQYVASEYKDKPKKNAKPAKTSSRKTVKSNEATGTQIASAENRRGIRALRHHSVRNDALLYLAKTYVQNQTYSDAQSLVEILDKDPNFPKRLRPNLYILNAQIGIATQTELAAIVNLEKALATKKLDTKNKQIVQFILGQLLARQLNYEASNKYFRNVIKLHPSLDMDFYSKVNMAKNASLGDNSNTDIVENMFKKIINDGKYINYLDRAYFSLAQTISKTKPEKAIQYFQKCIDFKTISQELKGEAYLSLADLFFAQLQYVPAQKCYDSALAFLPEEGDYNRIEIENRRNVLTDLVAELDIIKYNDSLLALSKLSEKEQKAIIKAALKQKEKLDQSKDVENTLDNSVTNNASLANNTNKSKWYFANPNTISIGKASFEAKFGKRPNVDNWNRKAMLVNQNNETNGESNEIELVEGEVIENESGFSKLANAIPKSKEKLDFCNQAVENALYNAAIIYFSGLNDNEKTIEYLEKLLFRFPNTEYKKQTYYTLFLANKKLNKINEANKYAALLKDDFPNSTYSKLAGDSTFLQSEKAEANTVNAYYSETYDLYNSKKYNEVLMRTSFAKQNYPEHKLMPKFDLLGIMAGIELKNYEEAKQKLEDFILANAGKEEATLAQDILALLTKNNTNLQDSNSVLKNMEPSFEKPNVLSNFVYDSKMPHYFIMVVRKIDGRLESVRSGMSDFNSINHSLEKIESVFYLIDQNTGVIVFKEFSDEKKARSYMKDIENHKNIYSIFKASELERCIISSENYELFKNTRNLEGYLNFYKKNYK
jgi:hypothetical protein